MIVSLLVLRSDGLSTFRVTCDATSCRARVDVVAPAISTEANLPAGWRALGHFGRHLCPSCGRAKDEADGGSRVQNRGV